MPTPPPPGVGGWVRARKILETFCMGVGKILGLGQNTDPSHRRNRCNPRINRNHDPFQENWIRNGKIHRGNPSRKSRRLPVERKSRRIQRIDYRSQIRTRVFLRSRDHQNCPHPATVGRPLSSHTPKPASSGQSKNEERYPHPFNHQE
jgi:hypothetical protein